MKNYPALCGTNSGFQRHKKYRQEVCESCRRANQEYQIEYNFNRNLKRAKLAEYARREKEATLHRAMNAMEVLASGRKTA